jgi:tetratricopeptide (TPR) repeat protein
MRTGLVACAIGAVALAVAATSGSALAQGKKASGGDKKASATASSSTLGPDGVRRDPAGIKGISPYHEMLAKGRKLFQNKDYDGAIASFQEAVKLDAKNAYAYVLIAEVQLSKGDVDAAKQTLTDARDKEGAELAKAKLRFLAADTSERAIPGIPSKPTVEALAPLVDLAKQTWDAYAAFVAEHTKAPDYRASSTERKKRLDGRVELEKAFVPVKQRITDRNKERAAEADKAAAAEAAKSK